MNEYLVEWTLLREQNYLQKCIDLPLERKVCQQYTTKYGRVDFVHKIKNDGFLITELETQIDSRAKFSFCIEQVKAYKQIKFNEADNHIVAILFAEQSNENLVEDLNQFANSFTVKLYTYDIEFVKRLYDDEIQKSLLTAGVPLIRPVAMNLTHLSAFNRLMIPFYENKVDVLDRSDFIPLFPVINSGKSESTFNVICRGAFYFDLLLREDDQFILTEYGKRFRDNVNAVELSSSVKRIPLSLEQKRILVESLLNGHFYEKKSKINLYYLLKFIALTDGEWIPRGRVFNDAAKHDFVNNFFQMNYSEGSVADLLNFTCNHCVELGLVERIRTQGFFDRAVITSFGSRVLNYLELDIHLKREKVQIPFQL